jgi:cytochrome c-type biogenesis protein CcmH
MVRGMVERLSERLHHYDGSDVEGWVRLVRSYLVLGEREKARAAAVDARRALASDPTKLQRLNDLVRGLGIEG